MKPDATEDGLLLRVREQTHGSASEPKQTFSPTGQKDWTIPGFCGKSKIATSFGHLPIEALRRNDPVRTSDGQYLKITWLKKIGLDSKFLDGHPEAQPMFVPQNSLGRSKPSSDMLLSPAQKIEVLRPIGITTFKAASLSGQSRITRKPHSQFLYYIFGCEKPCTVCIDGMWCELESDL